MPRPMPRRTRSVKKWRSSYGGRRRAAQNKNCSPIRESRLKRVRIWECSVRVRTVLFSMVVSRMRVKHKLPSKSRQNQVLRWNIASRTNWGVWVCPACIISSHATILTFFILNTSRVRPSKNGWRGVRRLVRIVLSFHNSSRTWRKFTKSIQSLGTTIFTGTISSCWKVTNQSSLILVCLRLMVLEIPTLWVVSLKIMAFTWDPITCMTSTSFSISFTNTQM